MNTHRRSAPGPAAQPSPESRALHPYRGKLPGGGIAPPAAISPPGPPRVVDEGEGSEPPPITGNAAFVAAVFRSLPDGATAAVCPKRGDPERGGWRAMAADRVDDQCAPTANNYVNASSFYRGDDGSVKALKARFAALHFLLLRVT